jgi:hypothetical protein
LAILLAAAGPIAAQTQADTAPRVPQGAFVGHLRNTFGSFAIQLADVRLYLIDSTREVRGLLGATTLDTYVDTAHSRLTATDSTGLFAIWRLAAGHYWMQARRIGFAPIEAFVTIDSQTVLHDFEMNPIPAILNKVEIKEAANTRLAKRLDRVGFMSRRKFRADGGRYLMASDWERARPQTVRDILVREGIFNNDVDIVMDWMSLRFDEMQDYPAELVAGIEIYRRERPVEFGGPRPGATIGSRLGNASGRRPLVIIWTHIPG